ncbi:hypothetical protein T07_14461 [Trichinella nelsoni]|uniref:Uncharacterized protein n=1 Tax=Trichinella nelsoni TaxID=6336 RepID=A0A0V0REF7_9BILA|nr:hypothetical protein T07_14461 [Trichinella nelsoni]
MNRIRNFKFLYSTMKLNSYIPVEDAEPLGPRQRIQRIVYARDGLSVNARHGIQSAVVDAEPRGAVLLSDQHYR